MRSFRSLLGASRRAIAARLDRLRATLDDLDCGVMFDARGVSGKCGYSATVFLTNIFLMPATEDEFLKLPKEIFDTIEELAEAGWVVD